MKKQKRYIAQQIANDLKQKMVFIDGPRQVGKTTMAKAILTDNQKGYLNWDVTQHRVIYS